ncbi:hypothetical protein ACQP2E_19560 [Actinoplanes sp. CA-015351]|uniref:hypothetical protein n=1 Tax=Actinoplanes sp. CA-015351 TaxID=3239897 RepID=UPI003D99F4D5
MTRRWIAVGAVAVVFTVAGVTRIAGFGGDTEDGGSAKSGAAGTGAVGAGAAGAGPAAPPSLAACQMAIATRPYPRSEAVSCDYTWTSTAGRSDEDAADPADPEYAGAALPTGMSTDGRDCVAGPDRPVLDTVFPVLSSSFTPVPGLTEIESTVQLRGISDRAHAQDLDQPGNRFGDRVLTATLDFARLGTRLRQGESYRWRVRGTPPSVPAGGWSPWCEFTIAGKTPDDLGLDNSRGYQVVLPTTAWRQISDVMGPVETYANGDRSSHEPIAIAAKSTSPRAQVTLSGSVWSSVVNGLAYHASEQDEPSYWELADLVSSALDGPPHPTMGFPRP